MCSDITGHLHAAVRIANLRYFQKLSGTNRPFDRLVVESILHSVFLSSIGLWSDGCNIEATFDLTFWLRAAQLLYQMTPLPNPAVSASSPVIDVPVALLKCSF